MINTLIPIIEGLPDPLDFKDEHHTWLSPLKLKSTASSHPEFIQLVDQFVEASKGTRKSNHVKTLRKHWELILLNLTHVVFHRRWLLVALDNRAFSSDANYRANGWSHGAMKTVVDYLEEHELITKKIGKAFTSGGKRTRIFPTAKLAPQLYQFFLDAEQPIKPPYTIINEPSEPWLEVSNSGGARAADWEEDELKELNNFLKDHSWACKGPVKLIYKTDPFNGGRLYTAFQNLPDRKARVRINTLIDGEAIAEVDFNANHLRLQLAVMYGQDAGETPYEDIGAIANVSERSEVKMFTTIAMGASDRGAAMNACFKEAISQSKFESLEAAFAQLYPELELFIGWGINAQNLEGQILKKVMQEGMHQGIVCLPVHDAVAVQQRHQIWAMKTMMRLWTEAVGCDVKPRFKLDKP